MTTQEDQAVAATAGLIRTHMTACQVTHDRCPVRMFYQLDRPTDDDLDILTGDLFGHGFAFPGLTHSQTAEQMLAYLEVATATCAWCRTVQKVQNMESINMGPSLACADTVACSQRETAMSESLSTEYDAYECAQCHGAGTYRDPTNADKHYSDAAGTTPCRACIDGIVWILKGFTAHWPAGDRLPANDPGRGTYPPSSNAAAPDSPQGLRSSL